MKGNLKLWLFGAMIVICLGVCVFSLVYHDGFLLVIALSLVCIGTTYFIRERKKIKNLEEYESEHIEEIDERNVFMQYKAGYISGKLLFVMSAIGIALDHYGYVNFKSWTFFSAAMLWMILQTILYAKYKYL